jgi:hypothetical protein
MPRLGAPVEPAQADGVDPWWRTVASAAPEPLADSDAPESREPMEQLVDDAREDAVMRSSSWTVNRRPARRRAGFRAVPHV